MLKLNGILELLPAHKNLFARGILEKRFFIFIRTFRTLNIEFTKKN